MYAGSSPRKAIHDIISNIRQIASNISKDVSMNPQTFPSQPTQDQYPPQRPHGSNYLQETIEIRNATSTRATVNFEESEQAAAQNTYGIAQGIKNAHTKIDQALVFMNNIKNKLEPETKCFSINTVPDASKESMSINAQAYAKSLPLLSRPQETPSLTSLPMTLTELGGSPKNGGPTYYGQHDTSRFNPFAKPGNNNMSEMLNLLEQKSVSSTATNQHYVSLATGATNALNFNSSRSNGQLMHSQIGSVPRKIHAAPVSVNNLVPAPNVDFQRKLITVAPVLSRPSSAAGLQSGLDYNRLNQIIHNIKQKGSSQQLSLNDMHMGTIQSLTSLHEQAAAEYELIRPNTVSHISSRHPVTSKGFAFPRENNFYQLPQPQYEVAPSHFSSQSSLYGATGGMRPNTAASGFLEAVQKATNQISDGEQSENRYYEHHEQDQEFCKPRRLKFEKERAERPVSHSRKSTANTCEVKRVKQRKVDVVQKEKKHHRTPTYQHKPHKVKDQQEIYEKRNYREVLHDDEEDSDSMVDDSVVIVRHSRKKREPSCHHESCASIQSDEESVEESVRYEIPRGKTITQRTVETKRSVCANCQCKKVAKQYVVYNTNTCSGGVSRSKRSLSRKKSTIDDHKVAFEESANTCEVDHYENRQQTLRRNKSIDCNRVRDSMGRKSHAAQRVVNNENAMTSETWTLSKPQKENQQGKVSFETLRKKDENQGDYKRNNEQKVNVVRSGAKESQNQVYSKVFVDQLALEFPAKRENDTYSNNIVVQKTEIMRSSNKIPRRIPF